MQHDYEKLARKAYQKIWYQSFNWVSQKGLELSPQDREECVREAVASMCLAAARHPQHTHNHGYMIVVGKRRILEFLFGSHHKVQVRTKGHLRFESQEYQGWLRTLDMRHDSSLFIEQNLAEIYQLLLNSRAKKAGRGASAALRDTQIVKLASLGWSNAEIGTEMGIKPDNVKKYRQAICKLLDKKQIPR